MFEKHARCSTVRAWCWVVVPFVLGCGAPAPLRTPPAPEAEPELHHGALVDYVPAAGLRWLIAGSPRALARAPALSELRQRWLDATRTAAFARATGIDLERTERGLIAGFELGMLYLADASGWVSPPELAFIDRLAGSERERRTHPSITTLSGLVGTQPQALVRVDDELVAFAVEDLTLARVVESFALRRFDEVATAFEGAALSGLPPDLRAPLPLALYLLGPLDPERVAATEELGDARALLAGVSALAVTLEPDAGELALQLALVGSWQGDLDAERLLAAWLAFAASPLGRMLGLDTPLEPPDAAGSESLLRLRTRLEGKLFALGLERSLTGDVGEWRGAMPGPSSPRNAPRR
jgi:hypothetical protein